MRVSFAKVEIPYILRSFLQFPSQLQIVNEIIPAIEKLETFVMKNKETCEIEAVIKYTIEILKVIHTHHMIKTYY